MHPRIELGKSEYDLSSIEHPKIAQRKNEYPGKDDGVAQ